MRARNRVFLVRMAFCGAGILCGLAMVAQAQQVASPNYRSAILQHTQAAEIAPRLQAMLADMNSPAEILVDRASNRLLIQASPQTQQLASELIGTLDRPPTPAATIQPVTASPIARGYSVAPGSMAAAEQNLRRLFPAASGVRIAPDLRTGQIIVVAQPETHRQVAQILENAGMSTAVVPARASTPVLPVSTSAVSPETRGYQLRNITWRELEGELTRVWGKRLSLTTQANGDVSLLSTLEATGPQPALQIDRRRNWVSFVSPLSSSTLWEQVVQALDQRSGGTADQSGVVTIRSADPAKIREAVNLVQSVSQNSAPATATSQPGQAVGPAAAGVLQPGDGDALGGAVLHEEDENQPGEEASGLDGMADAAEDGGLIGPVQIQFLEGLDAILIRGHKRDVERVRRIIGDIEDISQKTEPKIEVHQLNFIGSQVAVSLVTEIYDEILSPRQGQVSIRPLVKPNALLLIGRPESVDLVIELVNKLDTQVEPESQFEVFPLKHVSALDVQETIEAFFVDKLGQAQQGGVQGAGTLRPGLGTRVNVVGDYRSNSLIVHASPRDMDEVRRLIEKIDIESTAATNELRIFRLKNTLATDIAPVLQDALNWQLIGSRAPYGSSGSGVGFGGAQGFGQTEERARIRSAILTFMTVDATGGKLLESGLLSDVRVTADTAGNALVVTAPAKSMGLIEALIQQLDNLPAAKAQIKVFTIVNGDASALAGMLQQLLSQQATTNTQFGGTATFGTGSLNPFLQPSIQSAAATGESTLIPVRFAVDQRTNSIIASGAEGDLGVVQALLLRLDEEVFNEHMTTVYWLANSSATDVAESVNAWLDERTNIFADRLQISPESPEIQFNRQVIIVPEELSNSVIISAVPELFEEVKHVVESLDRRPPMVKIDVLIAEVSMTDDFEFGVEWGLQDSLLVDRTYNAGVAGDAPGYDFNNVGLGNDGPADTTVLSRGLTSFNLARVSPTTGYGGLVLGASSDAVSALLRALQQDRRAQILSRPQIMTLDGQGANVNVGQTVSRVLGSSATQNAVTQDVVDTPTGITLGVTPRVSPDGLIIMEVDVIKSALSDTTFTEIPNASGGAPILQAAIDNASAQTTVAAQSGQTVVFAGLIKTAKFNETRGIPWLSSIPVAGRLFRYDRESRERSELLIILTPHIVRGEEELDWIKLSETERMSWCLSDVYDIWGPDTFGSNGVACDCDSGCPTYYPVADPTGAEPVLEPVEEQGDYMAPPAPIDPSLSPQASGGELYPQQAGYSTPAWPPQPGTRVANSVQLQTPSASAAPTVYQAANGMTAEGNAVYQRPVVPGAY